MNKTAIFVEGHTELVFVREFLLKIFDYQHINLECYNLRGEQESKTEYPYYSADATHHFLILNVENDDNVLKYLLKREKSLWNAGYTKIIGLRDMYSKRYITVNGRKIDEATNQAFIDGTNEQLQQRAARPESINFCFAIMETEAWFLGLENWLEQIDAKLTKEYIFQKLSIDLQYTNPETTFFHPAKTLSDIYALAQKTYSKTDQDCNKIVGKLSKTDFLHLYSSDKCASFKQFYNVLEVAAI